MFQGRIILRLKNNHVLSTMVDSGSTNTKTSEPSVTSNSCDVHDTVSDRIFPRKKTLHNLQRCVSRRCIPNLLQRHRKLSFLEHKL